MTEPASTPLQSSRSARSSTGCPSSCPNWSAASSTSARAELTEKGKAAGLGVGLFSAAGILGLFALGTLIAAGILALDLALPAWAAALIVAAVLLAAAGVAAMIGKKEVSEATPPAPERAIAGVKEDVAALKGNQS